MQPLLIGIDQGVTLAYAILDLNGNVLKIKSIKNFGIKRLIKETLYFGIPIVVGTDVSPPPAFIKSFASSFGAKLIFPEKSITVFNKKKTTKELTHLIKNEHERDALFSALFAFKAIRKLLTKIDYSLKRKNKLYLEQEVKILTIKEGIPISGAIKAVA